MEAAATTATRHESELGWIEFVSREPHPIPRPHLRGYWGHVERTSVPMRRRELPTGDAVMIIGFGPPLRQLDPDEPSRIVSTSGAFVAGVHQASVVTEHDGESYGIDVVLTPLGARRILGVPMHELAGRVIDLDDVFGSAAVGLVERLHDAPSWTDRFDVLDAALAARLADEPSYAPALEWAWRRLVATDGRIPIGALAEELGCSRKYLVSQFREAVGVPPKTLARILRLQRAIRLLDAGGGEWGEIALECGYYDQAHFNRDFREFAGSTPTEFVARRFPNGAGLAAH